MMGGHGYARLLKTISAMVFIVLCLPSLSSATGFSGTYTMTGQGVTLKLLLKQDLQGNITGTLSSTTGISYQVEGMVEEGIAFGRLD
jgi:hypothetical protein